ncbi:cactin binding domain containing protein [Nitzschia inconspicua]|uniref:Splicing factor Cactin n=1 Tax=Nitzschia inconspicua TaxID=303405 RepID=A0A9K3K611_9STRA|nr:cactin binding domain containing protein [Nitzschia inconspicua]KAG7352937.1 cactin binding domain containing protein [Nitzschia inconspicua]
MPSSKGEEKHDKRSHDKKRDRQRIDKQLTVNREDDEVKHDLKDGDLDRHKEMDEDVDRKRKKGRRDDREHRSESNGSDDDSYDGNRRRRHSKRKRKRERSSKRPSKKTSSRKHKRHHHKSKKKRRYSSSESSSSSDSSSSDSSSSSSDDDDVTKTSKRKIVMNDKLLAKLNARGETLEERKERRAQKRAAKIQARFGYTAEENPFNDPNLHETFNWTKKKEKKAGADNKQSRDTIEEIETIRQRRKERELEREEMERLRAEESRMKELENYDEWAKKEEEFHLEQQRKRSAIRLVEGREKPIDILAKNLLLFGLTDEEKQKRAAVKYQERYNALDEVQKLDAELEEPHKIVSYLKLVELQELLVDIDAFRLLEKEAMGDCGNVTIITYWEALSVVVKDEIKLLQNGGEDSTYAKKMDGIKSIFDGQSRPDLLKMREEIETKLRSPSSSADVDIDRSYWITVLEQLKVHLAKMELSEMHSKMLVRQLEKLEQRKEELAEQQKNQSANADQEDIQRQDASQSMVPLNVDANFGNLEEELGLTDEIILAASGNQSYSWQDRYAPRKPRYFNRVRTGFDWNKYNQTHYDSENPPPKIVQGYKFNIFYPDLVDPTKTPQYFLEPADSNEFCILRFHAGPPYEDVAFKIINREWNKSRKRGFRSTFERGVLSLYFNFTTHWYRR